MKKIITFLSLFLIINIAFSQETKVKDCTVIPFSVYLDDNGDEEFSNIRESPNGQIILKLNNKIDYYTLDVIGFENGWLKINGIQTVDTYSIIEFSGWIHSSIVGTATRKKITLLKNPNGKIEKGVIDGEVSVIINDICSDWVKVEYENLSGWVATEWLCGNPVTTCP